MKKCTQFIMGLFFMLLAIGAKAQASGVEYFAGKWTIILKGLPTGDTKMIFVFEKKDSTITGVVQDSTGTELTKIDKAEVSAATATVYFTIQGYDVNLVMNKKDEDHLTGSLMNMFDAEGERVKAK